MNALVGYYDAEDRQIDAATWRELLYRPRYGRPLVTRTRTKAVTLSWVGVGGSLSPGHWHVAATPLTPDGRPDGPAVEEWHETRKEAEEAYSRLGGRLEPPETH